MPPETQEVQTAEAVITETAHKPFSVVTFAVVTMLLFFAVSISVALSWVETEKKAARNTQVAAAAQPIAKDTFASISLQAKSAYVLDLSTGKPLFALNENVQLPLASITKVPLVLAAAEVLDMSEYILISRGAVERGEGGGLGTGDTWRIRDLVDFTLLASSNAGAEALAESADAQLRTKYPGAPEGAAAVWRMNELADELGLSRTYFLNPSGLDIGLTQASALSSAREAALLVAHAARTQPALFAATTRTEAALGPENGSVGRVLNTNEALSDIPGIILGKTGFTDLAGGNLAIVFEVEPLHPIAIVVMSSTENGRFDDIRALVRATEAAIAIQ